MILVGAISSDKQNGPTDQAFQYAISRINQDKSLLPDTKFSFDLQHVAKYDSFHACQKGTEYNTMMLLIIFLKPKYMKFSYRRNCL